MIVTSAGQKVEIRVGDTEFDYDERVIRLKTPNSLFVIDGDSVESIEKHYGHLD